MINKALINKEFKLAIHPTSLLFLSLSFMMLIPNYPLYVTFFYNGLRIFFTCLQGRENNDIFFSLILPVSKKDVVKARFCLVVIIEILQMIIAIIAALFRTICLKLPNNAGMDANIAFFGFSFILLGIFNYTFFTQFYKNTDKVGKAFVVSSIFVWVYILLVEGLSFAVPFFHNILDTLDPANIYPKIVILVLGLIIFILLTILAEKKSIKSFEKLDY